MAGEEEGVGRRRMVSQQQEAMKGAAEQGKAAATGSEVRMARW